MAQPAAPEIPDDLARLLDELEGLDPSMRAAVLIEYADEFDGVPESIARRPYPEERRVPACESEAYVWAEDGPGGTLKYHFAVENPQGISAKALSVILARTVSGRPAHEIAAIPTAIVQRVFGRKLSMGKGAGLQGIVSMVTAEARRRCPERVEGRCPEAVLIPIQIGTKEPVEGRLPASRDPAAP